MSLNPILDEAGDRMMGAVDAMEREFRGIRTGRPSPELLDGIKVSAYGGEMSIKQLAMVGVQERSLVVKPFDPGTLKDIERAIRASDIGITPVTDGKSVRLNIPPLTEERRRQLVKHCEERAEMARVAIRNVRKDAKKEIEGRKKTPGISEDAITKALDDLQKLTDEYEAMVNETLKKKVADIMGG
ncbi:MAG: ribosome recycling factor [Planctomycetota bacterium]|nr:ribosome recycling factor [Planctomycetota bacterium]